MKYHCDMLPGSESFGMITEEAGDPGQIQLQLHESPMNAEYYTQL